MCYVEQKTKRDQPRCDRCYPSARSRAIMRILIGHVTVILDAKRTSLPFVRARV